MNKENKIKSLDKQILKFVEKIDNEYVDDYCLIFKKLFNIIIDIGNTLSISNILLIFFKIEYKKNISSNNE